MTALATGCDSTAALAPDEAALGLGIAVAGAIVESFLSEPDLSLADESLGGRSLADVSADAGVVGVSGALGSVVATVRVAGGGFIQSSTYGTATAPTTPSTITTRTTRNHVAAKMDRGATSSYSSWS
jgi:hypothetical protein